MSWTWTDPEERAPELSGRQYLGLITAILALALLAGYLDREPAPEPVPTLGSAEPAPGPVERIEREHPELAVTR